MFKRRYDKVNPGGRVWNKQLDGIENDAGKIANLLDEAHRIAARTGNLELLNLLAQSPKPLHGIMAKVAELRRIAE